MSFYRSLLALFAALALSLPAFADEATSSTEQAQPVSQEQTQTQAATQETADASQQLKVDLNKATIQDLTKIKGITPARAKAIVAYRKKNGDFKTIDDLKNVKGFKKMKDSQLKEIQDQLTLG